MTHSALSAQGTERSNHGVVTSVRGSVVDVRFERSLPTIYTLLRAEKEAEMYGILSAFTCVLRDSVSPVPQTLIMMT